MPDIRIENLGASVALFRPLTPAARAWIDTHATEPRPWFGGALAVEPRYLADLAAGAEEAGFRIDA